MNHYLFHNVFFRLAEGCPANAAELIAEGCRKHLPNIPGVVRLVVGTPANAESTVPADNSYAVALVVEFTDEAAHAAYEVHPDHLRFVDECRPLFGRVTVYDIAPVA